MNGWKDEITIPCFLSPLLSPAFDIKTLAKYPNNLYYVRDPICNSYPKLATFLGFSNNHKQLLVLRSR